MFKVMRYVLVVLVLLLFTARASFCEEAVGFPRPYEEEKVLSLQYGVVIDVMMSWAEGVAGPEAFFITDDRNTLFLSDRVGPGKRIAKFDLAMQKHLLSFDPPFQGGEIRQMRMDSDGNIICFYLSKTYGENIICKIDPEKNTLFEINSKKLPSERVEQIYDEYDRNLQRLGFSPRRARASSLSWRFFSTNQEGELFAVCLSSVLKYSPDGEFLGLVPGVGYPGTPYLYRLEQVKGEGGEYVGGKLHVFAEDGKTIRTVNIPRDRSLLHGGEKIRHLSTGPLAQIIGVDKEANVYLQARKQKDTPIIILEYKVPGESEPARFSIANDNIIYKFNKEGDLVNFYQTPGAIHGMWGFRLYNEVQITPDGSIYYWKFLRDRMELWRILPQS